MAHFYILKVCSLQLIRRQPNKPSINNSRAPYGAQFKNKMFKLIQEILIYVIVACSSLFIMSYAVHMLVGGLVNADTESLLIELICVIGIIAMGYMARDVIRRRKGIK